MAPSGETTGMRHQRSAQRSTWYLTVKQRQTQSLHVPSDFERGFLVGLLVGEGHFGGDGRQPHVTLRMHVRHQAMFDWILRTFGGRLYGPYLHGSRHYLQWMARGVFLREKLLPLLQENLSPELDSYASDRFAEMCRRYAKSLALGTGPVSLDLTTDHSAANEKLEQKPEAD